MYIVPAHALTGTQKLRHAGRQEVKACNKEGRKTSRQTVKQAGTHRERWREDR